MLRPLTLVAALALAWLAAPLAAQETATPTTETPTLEAPAGEAPAGEAPAGEAPAAEAPATDIPAPPAASEFDTGAVISDGTPQPGEPYVRETFGDWALRCLRAEEGSDPCQLYQLLLDDAGNPISEVSIVPISNGGEAVAGVVVVVPLETQLTEQLRLSIDGAQPRLYPFDFCNRAGCVARFGLVAEQIAQFKRGASGVITIVPAAAPDQTVNLTMSLIGFTAGFDATQTPPQ